MAYTSPLGWAEGGTESETDGENLTGYVVSAASRRRFRRLHNLAKRGLILGRDYRECVVYGADLLQAGSYDDVCARCWGTREAFAAKDPSGGVGGMASASSRGESEGAEATGLRGELA